MRVRKLLAVMLASGVMVMAVTGCEKGKPATAPSSAPAVTVADPHLISSVDPSLGIPGAKAAPSGAALVGPGYRFHIVETATVTSLGEDFLPWFKKGGASPTAPISAGPGNEFLLTRFSSRTGNETYTMFPRSVDISRANEDVKVRIGGETRVMPQTINEDAVLLLLVVPTGSPVTLVITVDGRDQGIDLRTGQPGAGSSDYSAALAGGTAEWDVYGGYPGDKVGSQVDVKASAYLSPYDDGWAKPGKIWLGVQLELSYYTWRQLGGELDAAKSIQVKVGGRTLTMDGEATDFEQLTSSVTNIYQNSLYAKVQVPKDSVHKVSVRFSPVGHLTMDGKTTRFQSSSAPTETITLR